MTNNADTDQFPSLQKPTDLDLHCLQRQGISGFSRTRVRISTQDKGRFYELFPPGKIVVKSKISCPSVMAAP